jgi:hypothetical protein
MVAYDSNVSRSQLLARCVWCAFQPRVRVTYAAE